MKKMYYFVLSILTAALLLLFAVLEINKIKPIVDLAAYQTYIDIATKYGCITLLCCFAFGGLIGRSIKIIFGIMIILALVIIILTTFCYDWVIDILSKIGIGGTADAVISFFKL